MFATPLQVNVANVLIKVYHCLPREWKNELIKRTLQVKENATRPEVRMIGHTGYITFGRKIKKEPNPYRQKKPKEEEYVDLNGMPLRG